MSKRKDKGGDKLYGEPFGYKVWLTPEGGYWLDWHGLRMTFDSYDDVIVWLSAQIIMRARPPTIH